MGKLKDIFFNLIALIYFLMVMSWVLLTLIFGPLLLFSEINSILSSGFSSINLGTMLIGILGLFIGISLLIKPLRRMYYKLPWMYSFVKILYINVVIMGIASKIISFGHEVNNPIRHSQFFIIMIIQLIISRIVMCLYFNKNRVDYLGVKVNG